MYNAVRVRLLIACFDSHDLVKKQRKMYDWVRTNKTCEAKDLDDLESLTANPLKSTRRSYNLG